MKKNLISLLCPTRGRPENALRLAKSLLDTTADPERIELLFYIDDDDKNEGQYLELLDKWLKEKNDPFAKCEVTIGPAISISESWNTIAARAKGDLLIMANDDQVYKTNAWDHRLDEEVMQYSDGVFCMWFEDGINGSGHCAFPIVSRVWYQTLGYFTPGIFKFIYNDTWLMELGKRCDRLHFISDIFVEHLHFTVNKSELDETYQRHRDPRDNHVEYDKALFEKTEGMRTADANKLLTVIQNYSAHNQTQII